MKAAGPRHHGYAGATRDSRHQGEPTGGPWGGCIRTPNISKLPLSKVGSSRPGGLYAGYVYTYICIYISIYTHMYIMFFFICYYSFMCNKGPQFKHVDTNRSRRLFLRAATLHQGLQRFFGVDEDIIRHGGRFGPAASVPWVLYPYSVTYYGLVYYNLV